MTMDRCSERGVFLSFYVICLSCFTSGEMHSFPFVIPKPLSVGAVAVGRYTEPSIISCCVKCFSEHSSPYLVYNKDERSCACSLIFSASIPPPSGSEQLYVHPLTTICDVINGYNVYVYKGIVVCLRLGLEDKTYSDAELACAEYPNGHLFISDVPEKFEILKRACVLQKTDFSTFWIGMDDRDTEGVFVWADERKVTEEEMNALFRSEPSNSFGIEHCVEYRKHMNALNDRTCENQGKFVCEIRAT